MKTKFLFPFVAVFLLFIMGVYFLTHPSYDKSLRAKYYYEIGDYQEAYALAKEAFSLDLYNRMASTIMTQSQTSLKYVAYIKMAEKYMKDINQIATKETVSDADKAKIRLICQIMMSSYIKLAPSVITDESLVKQTAKYHDDFEKLFEKVNR